MSLTVPEGDDLDDGGSCALQVGGVVEVADQSVPGDELPRRLGYDGDAVGFTSPLAGTVEATVVTLEKCERYEDECENVDAPAPVAGVRAATILRQPAMLAPTNMG